MACRAPITGSLETQLASRARGTPALEAAPFGSQRGLDPGGQILLWLLGARVGLVLQRRGANASPFRR